MNADHGSIELGAFADPVHDAAVCFAFAGSGAASDISPAAGFTETAEADNPGQNLIMSDFLWVGEHTSCDADFLHESRGRVLAVPRRRAPGHQHLARAAPRSFSPDRRARTRQPARPCP